MGGLWGLVVFFGNIRGQYKIQQMAFMILAIFFFFVLVGLFFVGWQYANLQRNVAQLQEEKALSALKVIADSTELNCEQSEDWCIDRDKLTAFSEYSYLYDGYWSIASIELVVVYPPRGERVVSQVLGPSEPLDPLIPDTCSSTVDHNGDGNPDSLVPGNVVDFRLNPDMGRLDHQSSAALGNARPPLLVYTNLVPGERIFAQNIAGSIIYGQGVEASCSKTSAEVGYGGVVGAFYTADGRKILERALADFSDAEGIAVPNSASHLYFYVVESNDFAFNYLDNSGGCDFSIGKFRIEECPIVETPVVDTPEPDAPVDVPTDLTIISSGEEPILCPAPYCDYYILYDSGQRNKQTFSAYVTVCEKIDRSHEICELAKLLLGVQIPDDL